MELTPKTKYYQYIRPRNISDVFYAIPELSYTKKLEIIIELMEKYNNIVIVNKALNKYKEDYILVNRVFLPRIKPTLKNICKRIKEEDEKKKQGEKKK